MDHILTKEHEGKTVFALPTGNNVSRGTLLFSQITKLNIIKVSRAFVTLSVGDCKHGGKYRKSESELHPRELSNDWNSGYKVFLTMKEFEAYKLKRLVCNKLKPIVQRDDLTDDQAGEICKIMGWNFDEN